jgi:hypothetical protein
MVAKRSFIGGTLRMVLVLGLGGAGWLGWADAAEASVRGRRGLEIEGAEDRRGFFFSTGASFGATFFSPTDVVGLSRINLVFGGGVTERFTLGVALRVDPYFKRMAPNFGADLEATGYLWRGLYLRGALGVMGVPRYDLETNRGDGVTAGLGGMAELGYEFFLNATAAMSVGIGYDVRFVPGDRWPRQTPLVGFRFSWF